MPKPSDELAELNDPYFLFYRLFLGFHAVVKSMERCSDKMLALDRCLHSTLLPLACFQQNRIVESIYELSSFSVTREMKLHSDEAEKKIYGRGKQKSAARADTRSISQSVSEVLVGGGAGDSATVIKTIIELLEGSSQREAPRSDSPARSPLNGGSVRLDSFSSAVEQDSGRVESVGSEATSSVVHETETEKSSHSINELSCIFLPPAPKHDKDCPFSRKNNKSNPSSMKEDGRSNIITDEFGVVGIPPLEEFTQMNYIDNPETLIRSCAVCGSQAILSAAWLTLSLLQQLHVIALAHLAIAPLVLPCELKSPSPREAVTEVYHMAQRFFEIALHASLALCHEIPLTDVLSIVSPSILLAAAEPQLKKLAKLESARDDAAGGVEERSGSVESPPPSALHRSHEVSSPFFNFGRDEESHTVKKNRTVAALVQATTHIALGLFKSIPVLWPSLEILKESSSELTKQQNAFSGVFHSLAEYTLNDVFIALRSGLEESFISGFMDASRGAVKAQKKLLKLGKAILKFEQSALPGKYAKQQCHPPSRKNSTHGPALGPADDIYAIVSSWNDEEAMRSWPWKEVKASMQPSVALLASCERDHASEYFELKQILVLSSVFFDLVEDKDEKEQVKALEDYLQLHPSMPHTHLPSFSLRGPGSSPVVLDYHELHEAAQDLYHRRKAQRYSRLGTALELLEKKVQPVVLELTNSSNGGMSSRGRQLAGLLFLLIAEVVRFREEITKLEGKQREEVENIINEANMKAMKQTDAVKDFIGLTMQDIPIQQPATSPLKKFERKLDKESEPKPLTTWRYFVESTNVGALEFLRTEKSKNAVEVVGLLPPLWIRMWLILCRSIFRSAATDLIFAKETEIADVRPPADATTSATPDVASKDKPTTTKKGPATSNGSKKANMKKGAEGKKLSKKEQKAKEEAEQLLRMKQEASLSLQYSSKDICFWSRWKQLLIGEIPSRRNVPETLSSSTSTLLDSVPELCRALFGLLYTFVPPEEEESSRPYHSFLHLSHHLFPTLYDAFPIFPDGKEAFAALIKFGGSTQPRPHACAFAKSCQNAPLFPSPSVTACTPGVAKLVTAYWTRLGSPPLQIPAE